MMSTQRKVLLAVIPIAIGLVVVTSAWLGGKWLWVELETYIRPGTATERKDLANIFVLIAAGVIGALTAIAALGNLYFSRKNLQNAQAALRQQRDLDVRRR